MQPILQGQRQKTENYGRKTGQKRWARELGLSEEQRVPSLGPNPKTSRWRPSGVCRAGARHRGSPVNLWEETRHPSATSRCGGGGGGRQGLALQGHPLLNPPAATHAFARLFPGVVSCHGAADLISTCHPGATKFTTLIKVAWDPGVALSAQQGLSLHKGFSTTRARVQALHAASHWPVIWEHPGTLACSRPFMATKRLSNGWECGDQSAGLRRD